MDLKAAAIRGAKLLDDKAPGWRSKVNTSKLNMESRCVLDYVYGDYLQGIVILDLNSRAQIDYGFALGGLDDTDENWEELRDHWIEIIDPDGNAHNNN